MDLSKTMTISVTASYVTTPLAGDRPDALPGDAVWPPPDGTIIMYTFGDTGIAVCSECVIYPDRITSVRRYYDVSLSAGDKLRSASRADNRYYYCNVLDTGDGSQCPNQGSRLP